MRWLAFLLAVPGFALGPVLPDFLPPDSKVVIGIQLRRVMESPIGKSLAAHAVSIPQTKVGGIDFAKGMDFLKDVDEVLVAASGTQSQTALLVLKGRFQAPAVLEDPQNSHMLLTILDASTAIAGDADLVRAAMSRRGKGARVPASLEARVAPLAARYAVWGVGNGVDTIDGFWFGADLSQGLDVNAEMQLHSAADVEKFNQMLKPFQAMLRAQTGASKFDLRMQGRTLRVSLLIPQAELEKAIEAQKQALTSMILQQMAPPQMTPPQMTPLPTPKPKDPGQILKNEKGDTVSVRLPGGE